VINRAENNRPWAKNISAFLDPDQKHDAEAPLRKRDMNRLFVRDRRSDKVEGPGSVYAGKKRLVWSSKVKS